MASKFAKIFLLKSLKILNKVKEGIVTKKVLDWECITQPLKESPNDSFTVHKPTIEEYKLTYVHENKVKTVYDWWYSGVLKDPEGNLYFLVLVFHPKWSFFRIVRVDKSDGEENLWALPRSVVAGSSIYERMGYSERENEIEIWARKTGTSGSSETEFARSIIRAGESYLTLKKDNIIVYLTVTSLGLPFWINKGHEAISTPRGDTMSGFYDICQVRGSLIKDSLKTEIHGVGINEHLMSFTPPTRFWKRVDGIFICSDQLYCAFIYLENKVGARQYEYKDGAVFLRSTDDYLIPLDFKIEYLEFDELKKVPIKIRIIAYTKKGELNLVAQAACEIEKQLALRIVEGQFEFKEGKRLELTNGYGQHALH